MLLSFWNSMAPNTSLNHKEDGTGLNKEFKKLFGKTGKNGDKMPDF